MKNTAGHGLKTDGQGELLVYMTAAQKVRITSISRCP